MKNIILITIFFSKYLLIFGQTPINDPHWQLIWEDQFRKAIQKLENEKKEKINKTKHPNGIVENVSTINQHSSGKIIQISKSGLTILEYNFNTDIDSKFNYLVSQKTQYKNIDGFTDLKKGDNITIDYLNSRGKRIITTLVKDK